MGVECRYYLLPRPNTFRPPLDQLRRFVDLLYTTGWVPTDPEGTSGEKRAWATADWGGTEAMSIEEGLAQIPASGIPSRDLCFVWECGDWHRSLVRYPFVFEPAEDGAWDYDVQVHLAASGHFAHDCGNTVDLIEDSCCDTCGLELDCLRVEERERKKRKLASFLLWRWIRLTIPKTAPLKPALQKTLVGSFLLQRATPQEPVECKGRHASPLPALSRLLDQCPSCGKAFDPSARIAKARDPRTSQPFEIQGGVTYRFALMIECGKSLPDLLAVGPLPINPIKPELLELCQHSFGTEFYSVCVYH